MNNDLKPNLMDRVQATDPTSLPPGIISSIERHKARVAELVTALRGAGMSDDIIDSSVRSVVASYEQELVKALRDLEA